MLLDKVRSDPGKPYAQHTTYQPGILHSRGAILTQNIGPNVCGMRYKPIAKDLIT